MDIHELTEKSIYIITEYYKNNLQPYFDSIDDDILWIGPAEGQFMRTKKVIIDAWQKEEHNLIFSMNNISSTTITSGRQYCEVLLHYIVFTHYPDGSILHHDQRLHYTWCERKVTLEDGSTQKIPKILMIHISNAFPYDDRDKIYPVHFADMTIQDMNCAVEGKRIFVRGIDQFMYYLLASTIQWIESEDKGVHSRIHMIDQKSIVIMDTVSKLSAAYSEFFIRIHASYLINPLYIRNLRRFEVELADGTVLPVPEKKYTRIKKEINNWFEEWSTRREL